MKDSYILVFWDNEFKVVYSIAKGSWIVNLSLLFQLASARSELFEPWLTKLFMNKRNIAVSCIIGPPHDKTNKMTVRPTKTQISLGIRLVWSESSLCTQWVAKDPSFLPMRTAKTGRMPRLIWVFAGRTVILLVLSWGGLIMISLVPKDPFVRIYSSVPFRLLWFGFNIRRLLYLALWIEMGAFLIVPSIS